MIERLTRICTMLITTAVMLSLSGCWDSRELNEIGIVMGVGLDKAIAPDEIEMTLQIVNISGNQSLSMPMSKSKAESSETPVFFNIKDNGADVLSILHKFTYALSRKLYFSHNQLIIFGEDLAKEGVRDSFDFFMRSYEPRMTVYIFVAKGRSGEIFNVNPSFEKILASEIYTLMQDPIGSIDKTVVYAKDFATGLISKTTSIVAPMIAVAEQSGKKQIRISGLAVFKGDRLVGELDAKESRGYQWVTGKVNYSALKVIVNKALTEIIITSSKGKVTPVIKEDGSVVIRLEITAEGSLDSQTSAVNFTETENVRILRKEAERTIKQEVENTINKTRETNTDIFGFGESVYRKYPREWETIKSQWEKIYNNIEVEIDVMVNVKGTGRISKLLYPEKE